jgi:chemosensory pili system protein ChpA (sensor histidine kinase/response regulator)
VQQASRGEADPAAVREQIVQAVTDFVSTASDAATLAPPVSAPAPTPATHSGLEDDDEMRAIFLEEAQEVMGTAGAALDLLTRTPEDIEQLTTVRRSFHTLKGSSRMVGLNDFGEAAWACEQLYNTWLADQKPASEDLMALTGEVLDYLAAWIGEIAARVPPSHHSAPVRMAADAMRLEGRRMAVHAPGAPTAVSMPAQLPVVEPVAPAPPAIDLPAFTLDLSAFEDAAAPVPPGPEPLAPPPTQAERPTAQAAIDFGDLRLDLDDAASAEVIEAAPPVPEPLDPSPQGGARSDEGPEATPEEPASDQVKVSALCALAFRSSTSTSPRRTNCPGG